MTQQVIDVRNVSKTYTKYASELHRFARWFGLSSKPSAEYVALSSVSFQISAGEAVGLLGENGAGKSTVLKLISGTIVPTSGEVRVTGSISAILELGLGFNPEFTGAENVLHSAALLGYSPETIREITPKVEAFAELGDYFHRPFRVYSSGMQARLAFSLATAVRPDLLIVDEVLSVGDAYFQHKSFNRIAEFKEAGTAIVLVSHDLSSIRTLCDRALVLERGHVVKEGPTDVAVDYYNAAISAKTSSLKSINQVRRRDGWLSTTSGSGEVSVRFVQLLDRDTFQPTRSAVVGQRLRLTVSVRARAAVPTLVLGIALKDRRGHLVWGSNTFFTEQSIQDVKENDEIDFHFDFDCDLGPGSYSVTYAFTDSDSHLSNNYNWTDNAIVFEVHNLDRPYFEGTSSLTTAFAVREPTTDMTEWQRVAMTIACDDCAVIPKVEKAGAIETIDGKRFQIMHNGLLVKASGYHGGWMSNVIDQLQGHHEPQEELIFHHLLQHVDDGTLFVELGSFWSYYSMWYLRANPSARALCVEPDPMNMAVGQENVQANNLQDRVTFLDGWVGRDAMDAFTAVSESLQAERTLPQFNFPKLVEVADGQPIEVLHCDAQGAELGVLQSISEVSAGQRPRFGVISTHHHSISNSKTTHRDCIDVIESLGGKVLLEHSVEESYSGDGLIVCAFREADFGVTFPEISRNSPAESLFRGR